VEGVSPAVVFGWMCLVCGRGGVVGVSGSAVTHLWRDDK
jgi:hypothetical protein